MEKQAKKQGIKRFIQAILISMACSTTFQEALDRSKYTEQVDYYLAQIGVLLGEYRFETILYFLLAYVFLGWMEEKTKEKGKKQGIFLPFFFAFCLLMGKSYVQVGSWNLYLGSAVQFVKFVPVLIGMTILLQKTSLLAIDMYEKASCSAWTGKISRWLFGKNCFRKVFCLLLLWWLPVILVSYPGNLCYDVIGQIEQVLGRAPYSAHHPLLHTLLVGGCVKLGGNLFGSYDMGLFIYILLQAVLLASSLAGSLAWLTKQKFAKGTTSHVLLLVILGVYCLSPMYSNMVSTAIKDIPFVSMFLWYMILFAEIWQHRQRLQQPVFMLGFVVVQILVCVLRNNGFYVVFLTGMLVCFWRWKQAQKKERVQIMLYFFFLPVLLSKLLNGALLVGLDAKEGKAAEIFSLPFQQTARYLQLYKQEITNEERIAIENILGDVNVVAASYDPDIADPVKGLYYEQEEVTAKEHLDYFLVWAQGFFKHPCVYIEGFFIHVYGWFSPGVTNAIRYEAQYDIISQDGLFSQANKVLIFLYRFADRFTPLGVLQNVGAYTWGLLLLFAYGQKKNKRVLVLFVPLLVSLLICMASPCFYLHPRYAFPYMFTLPLLVGIVERSRE